MSFESAEDVRALIEKECNDIRNLLIAKNKKYGNSALNPVRLFSKGSAEEGINVRIDDKLSRISHGFGNDTTATDATAEDTEQDLIGYLILKRVLRRLNDANKTGRGI